MARVFPSDLSKLALAGAHRPELATLALLRKRLPDDYTVFHGVHWSREYEKWTHFGEVDFVVVNRSGDVLLVEQKNGALVDGGDGLVKQYEDGDKNVNDQIRRSVDKVRQKFKWQHGSGKKLGLDYLIYCPDHRVVKVNAAALDMSRIVDASARDGLGGRIQSVLGPGSDVAAEWGETFRAFFRQTLDLVPDIHAHIDAQESAFVFEIGNDLPGLGTGVHGYDDPEEQLRIVARVVRDLNRRGFDHRDIVVLTCHGVGNSVFSACEKVGKVRLRRFTGDYDLFGNQLSTDGQLANEDSSRPENRINVAMGPGSSAVLGPGASVSSRNSAAVATRHRSAIETERRSGPAVDLMRASPRSGRGAK